MSTPHFYHPKCKSDFLPSLILYTNGKVISFWVYDVNYKLWVPNRASCFLEYTMNVSIKYFISCHKMSRIPPESIKVPLLFNTVCPV